MDIVYLLLSDTIIPFCKVNENMFRYYLKWKLEYSLPMGLWFRMDANWKTISKIWLLSAPNPSYSGKHWQLTWAYYDFPGCLIIDFRFFRCVAGMLIRMVCDLGLYDPRRTRVCGNLIIRRDFISSKIKANDIQASCRLSQVIIACKMGFYEMISIQGIIDSACWRVWHSRLVLRQLKKIAMHYGETRDRFISFRLVISTGLRLLQIDWIFKEYCAHLVTPHADSLRGRYLYYRRESVISRIIWRDNFPIEVFITCDLLQRVDSSEFRFILSGSFAGLRAEWRASIDTIFSEWMYWLQMVAQ